MLIKNNSQKVIHVGSVMILPEETKPVDDSLSTAPAVAALIARNALVVIKAPRNTVSQVAERTEGTVVEESGGEATVSEGNKPLSRMNKQELVDECLKLGLDILETDTKDTLAEKIRAATVG